MELRLRYRSSGKLLTFHSAKVLKNSSSLPAADRVKLAFFVPYQSQWVFYPLRRGSRIQHNDVPARGPCKLGAGDLLSLQGAELVVESVSVDDPASAGRGADSPPVCHITVLGGKDRWHSTADTETLIGSADYCGLRLPAESGVEAEHAFLAYAEGAWHIHSLTGQADLIRALGKEGEPSVRLENIDRIWLGNTGLSIRFSDAPPEEPVESAQRPVYRPAKPSADDTRPMAKSLADTASMPIVECPIPPLVDHSQEPAYIAARELCVWLHKALMEPPPSSSSRVWEALVAVKTRLGRRSKDPVEALQHFRTDLEQGPHNHDLLVELARYLEARGYFDLCRLVLAQIHVLEPKDFDTLLALTKIYLMEGRQTARPLGERLDFLGKAEKWGRKGQLLRPKNDEIHVLVQQAEVEQTLLKGNLDGTTARHRALVGH
jgi:hypothetical protein